MYWWDFRKANFLKEEELWKYSSEGLTAIKNCWDKKNYNNNLLSEAAAQRCFVE